MHMIRRNALYAALFLNGCVLAAPGLVFAQDAGVAAPGVEAQSDSVAPTEGVPVSNKDAVSLEGVVVTGKIEYRTRVDVPAPVLVYDQQFFAKFEPVSVGDQLRRVPGVAFTSDIGESDAPQLRGLGHGYTQILINGRPVPSIGNDRSVMVDRIPAEIIDRIEIIRSPSADIDSQGVGGSINIVLKDGASLPPGVIARVGAMVDTKTGKVRPNASVSWSGSNEAATVFYSMTLDAQKRYNQKHAVQEIFESDSVGFDSEVAAGGAGRRLQSWDDRTRSQAVEREEQQDIRDSEDLSFHGDLTWQITDDSSLRLDAFLLSTRREESENSTIYEGDGSIGGLDLSDPSKLYQTSTMDEDSRGVSATFDSALNDLTSVSAHVGFNSTDGDTVKDYFKDTPDNKDKIKSSAADDQEWIADVSMTRNLPGVADSFGIDGVEVKFGLQGKRKNRDYQELAAKGLSKKPSSVVGSFNYKENRLDAFGRIDWHLSPALTLTTGVRAESTRTKQVYTNSNYAADQLVDSEQGRASDDSFMLNPSAHVQWKLSDSDQVRFSVARTVRRPSIEQLMPSITLESPGDWDITVGNPGLAMERSLGFDLGYERQIGQRGIVGANVFSRRIEDLIGLVRTSRPVTDVGQDPDDFPGAMYSFDNLGSARVHGAEFDLSMPLTFMGLDNTGIFGNYTRLFSERPDPVLASRKIRVDDQPTYVYNVGVTHDIPGWGASLGASYQRQGASQFSTIGEVDRSYFDGNLDLFLEKRLGKKVVMRLTGSNLLDACSYSTEPNFAGDDAAEIMANQAAYLVDLFEVERECSSPRWSLTLRAVF